MVGIGNMVSIFIYAPNETKATKTTYHVKSCDLHKKVNMAVSEIPNVDTTYVV